MALDPETRGILEAIQGQLNAALDKFSISLRAETEARSRDFSALRRAISELASGSRAQQKGTDPSVGSNSFLGGVEGITSEDGTVAIERNSLNNSVYDLSIQGEIYRAQAAEGDLAEQVSDANARIDSVENLGSYVGSFPDFASLPTDASAFPNGITANDFTTIRADETHGGVAARYVVSGISDGVIAWDFDLAYSQDITGLEADIDSLQKALPSPSSENSTNILPLTYSPAGTSDEFARADHGHILDPSTMDYISNYVKNSMPLILPSVRIGSQVWTTVNLGSARLETPDYGVFYNDGAMEYFAGAGKLYSWKEAMEAQSLFPGWHVPTSNEWNDLLNYINGTNIYPPASVSNTSQKLKSVAGWNSYSGIAGTNEYGFSALPAGAGQAESNTFSNVGTNGTFWTSTEAGSDSAILRYMLYNNNNVNIATDEKNRRGSVRLVRDN